jgi:hypothetical protein
LERVGNRQEGGVTWSPYIYTIVADLAK